jgi:8-oxo-dGTP pyrophosphatase MutT (NUDIX family)
VIFDETRQKVLLTRRTDNGQWCLPGGGMDPGENAQENCEREVLEETGLQVRVVRLIGIYTSPDYLVEYADGNLVQVAALCFEAEVTGGELGLSNETTDYGYFTLGEIENLDMLKHQVIRIQDALSGRTEAYIR